MEWLVFIRPLVWACVLMAQLLLLLAAAWSDIASRLIPNRVCLAIGITGAASRLMIGPVQMAESIAIAAIILAALLPLFSCRMLGGGDVKLLAAMAIGLPLPAVVQLFSATALAGGALALSHLAMRRLPRPAIPRTTASMLRRVYAAERWRI